MTATAMTDLAWLSRVARELGEIEPGTWTDETNGDGSYHVIGWLNGPIAGLRITVMRARSGSGWQFQPTRPLVESGADYVRTVTMPGALGFGYGRDPAAVAKRISRDLLPAYRAALAEHEDAVREALDAKAAKARVESQIRGALDGTVAYGGALVNRGMAPAAEFKVNPSGREVDVELRWCSPALAVDIAELLQRHAESEA